MGHPDNVFSHKGWPELTKCSAVTDLSNARFTYFKIAELYFVFTYNPLEKVWLIKELKKEDIKSKRLAKIIDAEIKPYFLIHMPLDSERRALIKLQWSQQRIRISWIKKSSNRALPIIVAP